MYARYGQELTFSILTFVYYGKYVKGADLFRNTDGSEYRKFLVTALAYSVNSNNF